MKTPQDVIAKADSLDTETYQMQKKFESCCPDPKEIERTISFDIVSIASLDAQLRIDLAKASAALDRFKTVHAKINYMCRMFYLRDKSYDVDEYRKFGWEWTGNRACLKNDLDWIVPADDVYAAYTLLLSAHQRRVDMLKQNIGVLTERGRQYKSAVEYLRFRSGN